MAGDAAFPAPDFAAWQTATALADLDRRGDAWPALLPWQEAAAARALHGGRAAWPPALLLTGATGIGKLVLAVNLARALLCEAAQPDGLACGSCASCRYVAAGQHPDLRLVEPFDLDDDVTLKAVEQVPIKHVRALIDWANLTSHRGVAKVAIVTPADRLNAAAANALLKTLEEPPAGTHLVLVTARPGRLLPTVRSRCQVLAAPIPAVAEASAWLREHGVAEPPLLLAQAGGAPLAALALREVQDERAAWLAALAQPRGLSAVGLAARIDAADKSERKLLLGRVIDWLVAWVADLARVAAGGAPQRNPDHATALRALAPTVAPVALFRYHRSLLAQRALVAHPLVPRLVAETILIRYRELFR
ncbi:MAG: DNA polymerase III subunit delta' [Burkholderiales bacterium]|nr:DNA polymerase III subunit delta' [Burkholderiales bacterium]